MAPSSTVVAPLLSVSMVTMNALVMPPHFSSAPPVPPSVVLASTSTYSHPCVSLDHIYTSSDADSLWNVSYKPEQKTMVGFVSAFDKNLIQATGFQHVMDSTKVFLQ